MLLLDGVLCVRTACGCVHLFVCLCCLCTMLCLLLRVRRWRRWRKLKRLRWVSNLSERCRGAWQRGCGQGFSHGESRLVVESRVQSRAAAQCSSSGSGAGWRRHGQAMAKTDNQRHGMTTSTREGRARAPSATTTGCALTVGVVGGVQRVSLTTTLPHPHPPRSPATHPAHPAQRFFALASVVGGRTLPSQRGNVEHRPQQYSQLASSPACTRQKTNSSTDWWTY